MQNKYFTTYLYSETNKTNQNRFLNEEVTLT